MTENAPFVVAALYKFTTLSELDHHREALLAAFEPHGVKGTILLAPEGVNGTIAGSREGIDAALAALRALPGCDDLEHKESFADEHPFLRLKIRKKKEIVTLGVDGVDPSSKVGRYVSPEDWNAVLEDPDTVVIDTRNDYEVAIGTFEGAVDPETEAFSDFPAWFEKFRQENKKPKVAMFCTGGIRCEKATSYLLQQGVEDVVHLKGGILKYLEHVDPSESKWQGECFVFDQRVAVRHGLEEGEHELCYACRRPISPEMMASPSYEVGVSCPQCIDDISEEQRAAFKERQKQVRLAAARGETHIGDQAGKPRND